MMETTTKSKRVERKEEIRKKILDVAKDLFLKHGYESVSIRKIADKVGISPTTIYLYYQDKSDVIYALHQEGFKALAIQFAALKNVEDPFERLKAMGRNYIDFSLRNPDFYQLMFMIKDPIEFVERNCASEWEEGEEAFGAMLATVADCKEHGYFGKLDLHSIALHIWFVVHGICSLKLQGHLDHVVKSHIQEGKDAYALDDAFETLITIMKGIK